jgi:hypothetical protein
MRIVGGKIPVRMRESAMRDYGGASGFPRNPDATKNLPKLPEPGVTMLPRLARSGAGGVCGASVLERRPSHESCGCGPARSHLRSRPRSGRKGLRQSEPQPRVPLRYGPRRQRRRAPRRSQSRSKLQPAIMRVEAVQRPGDTRVRAEVPWARAGIEEMGEPD